MRRKGSDIFAPARQRALEAECAHLSPETILEALLPIVTEDRVARVKALVDQRMDGVSVLFDAPHDPRNGAALVRTCDAFGVQNLHVVERREPFLAAHTIARGSEKWIDVHTYSTAEGALAAIAKEGVELLATRMDGELLPEDLRHVPRFCLLLGKERDGLSDDLQAAATRSVRVPMRGMADSLNVSVTAAILLQRALEGRPGDMSEARRRFLLARGLLRSVERARDVLVAKGILGASIASTSVTVSR